MSSRKPKKRLPLTRERVVAAGIAIADESGVDSLTMRRLGSALGVEAMSLYNHVADKDDLIAAMLDTVVGEYQLPSPEGDWKRSLRDAAISANQVLVRHPWAPGLLLTFGAMPGENWRRWSEGLLATLRRAGFSPEMTHHAYHALEGHIDGHSLRQVNFTLGPEELRDAADKFMSGFDHYAHPYLVEHIRGHLEGGFKAKSGFEFGLDLILDGLDRSPRA